MADDIVAVTGALRHDRFAVVGHDRDGRVGCHLPLDHAERVERLGTLDIIATKGQHEQLASKRRAALSGFHWYFLAAGAPLPRNADRRARRVGRSCLPVPPASFTATREVWIVSKVRPRVRTSIQGSETFPTPAGSAASVHSSGTNGPVCTLRASAAWEGEVSTRQGGSRVVRPLARGDVVPAGAGASCRFRHLGA